MGSYSDKENTKSLKREAAEARQKEYNALSISERIARLDAKLGVGVGAVKERAKLAKQTTRHAAKIVPAPKVEKQEEAAPVLRPFPEPQ